MSKLSRFHKRDEKTWDLIKNKTWRMDMYWLFLYYKVIWRTTVYFRSKQHLPPMAWKAKNISLKLMSPFALENVSTVEREFIHLNEVATSKPDLVFSGFNLCSIKNDEYEQEMAGMNM